MAKKKTRLEKFKIWLDKNPKIKSALNTFSAGFALAFIIQVRLVDIESLPQLIEGGAIYGILLAAVRAGLIAGVTALWKLLISMFK